MGITFSGWTRGCTHTGTVSPYGRDNDTSPSGSRRVTRSGPTGTTPRRVVGTSYRAVVSFPGRNRNTGTGTGTPPQRSSATRFADRSRPLLWTVTVIVAGSPRETRSGSARRTTANRGRHAATANA